MKPVGKTAYLALCLPLELVLCWALLDPILRCLKQERRFAASLRFSSWPPLFQPARTTRLRPTATRPTPPTATLGGSPTPAYWVSCCCCCSCCLFTPSSTSPPCTFSLHDESISVTPLMKVFRCRNDFQGRHLHKWKRKNNSKQSHGSWPQRVEFK